MGRSSERNNWRGGTRRAIPWLWEIAGWRSSRAKVEADLTSIAIGNTAGASRSSSELRVGLARDGEDPKRVEFCSPAPRDCLAWTVLLPRPEAANTWRQAITMRFLRTFVPLQPKPCTRRLANVSQLPENASNEKQTSHPESGDHRSRGSLAIRGAGEVTSVGNQATLGRSAGAHVSAPGHLL